MKHYQTCTCFTLLLVSTPVLSENPEGWFARGYAGYSILSDQNVDTRDVDPVASKGDVNVDDGFAAGLGIGYRFNKRFAAEFAWEYRSHDSEVALDSGGRWDDGNYASNTFWANGFYYLGRSGRWQPYLGAGIGYIEEIDIDLERSGEKERSFSDDGDITWQVFGGVEYWLNDRWQLHGELRYSWLEDVDLKEESGSGQIKGADYDPVTVQFGVSYRF